MNLKKMLAILLAAIMLLSLIPLTALAEEGDAEPTDPAYTETMEPEEPTEEPSTDPEDPVDVTDPADDPSDNPADDPADDPSDPTDPVDDPEDPADLEDPEDPENPSDPSDLTDPVVDPEDPTDPEDPEDPNGEMDLEEIDDERSDAGETTYALWDADTKTLTLYYGTAPSDAVVTGFGYSYPGEWGPFRAYRETCTTIVIESSFANARPLNLHSWFRYFTKVSSLVGIEYLNTSECTDLYCTFADMESLKSIDVSGLDTSKVTNMKYTFSGSILFSTLDLSNWDTSNVTDMFGMFNWCLKLESVDLSSFDTSKVTNMETMFSGCESLTSLDLSKFNTSNVTTMKQMFSGCKKLHTVFVDGNKWNISKITSSYLMFNSCPALVGGAGTVVTSESKAYIDTPKDPDDPDSVAIPGYLTDIADKGRMNMGLSNDTEVLKQFYVDPIVTTANNVVFAKLPKNSYPRFSTTSYPKLLEEQYAGYIFAGYFDSVDEGATASREATETTGYARFIPIEVLDVYVQFRHVSRAATNPESKTDLRFITSVPDTDTLGYNGALVGFKLLNVTDGFTISNHAFGTEYCYDEITGNYKVSDGAGGQVSLTPERFYASISAKVALQTVIGMPNTYFDNQKTLSVQPYIITLDGTYSYATVHPFQLKYAEDGSKTAVPVA